MYYPKFLALTPLLIFGGLLNLFYPAALHPAIVKAPKSKLTRIILGIVGFALAVFGFTVFTDWFLATFSKR